MIIDTRGMPDGAVERTTVCIVGGGVAGITLALELERRGVDSRLLESGGFGPDKGTRDLARGENVGLPYHFADGQRLRYLGGNSNAWGGWCGPWDPWDFDKRSWVPNSGWPFDPEELEPYWDRTHEILELGPRAFDTASWVTAIDRPDVHEMRLPTGRVNDGIAQFSAPTRFGTTYRKDLSTAQRLCVLLHANVSKIECDPGSNRVSRVEAKTLTGRTVYVEADQFILATGGIENARLLLVSNDVRPAGLGNGNDLVGRYFMDNPRLYRHCVRFNGDSRSNGLYDTRSYRRWCTPFAARGTSVLAHFLLCRETQEKEGLLNARSWLSSAFPGEGTEGALALNRRMLSLLSLGRPDWRLSKDLTTILAHPLDTFAYGLTRFFRPHGLIKRTRLYMVIEQSPNPDSRIMLSNDRDRLGINRIKVDWRLGELEARTFNRGFELLAEEFHEGSLAEVELEEPVAHEAWPATIEGTWHHMGTTRMHDSPKHGVVDSDCRVHDLSNLFAAGSSVFPTAGPNYPTMLIVALTLRLADHLEAVLTKDSAALVVGASAAKE